MKEQIVNFGNKKSLIGVLTQPSKAQQQVAFIFVNSGLIHRVGPFQFHVAAARALANDGFISLRMDLSGKGDSSPRKTSLSYAEIVVSDIDAAMTHIEKLTGVKRFVVCGICTGADNSYEAAFSNERVVGIVPVDGYAYRTVNYYIQQYSPKVRSVKFWGRLIKRTFKRILGDVKDSTEKSTKSENKMTFPAKRIYELKMNEALAKGLKVLAVYTGGWSQFYNYASQYRDAFPELYKHPGLQVDYFPESDHTFILIKDRNDLIDLITHWARQQFYRE